MHHVVERLYLLYTLKDQVAGLCITVLCDIPPEDLNVPRESAGRLVVVNSVYGGVMPGEFFGCNAHALLLLH